MILNVNGIWIFFFVFCFFIYIFLVYIFCCSELFIVIVNGFLVLLFGWMLIDEGIEVFIFVFVFVFSNFIWVEKFFFLLERFCNVIFCVSFIFLLLGLIRLKLILLGFINIFVWVVFGMLIKLDFCVIIGYVFLLILCNVLVLLVRVVFNCFVV